MPSAEIPKVLDGDIVRDMNETELAQYAKDQKEQAKQAKAVAQKLALRDSVIAKLGLTVEELESLLG